MPKVSKLIEGLLLETLTESQKSSLKSYLEISERPVDSSFVRHSDLANISSTAPSRVGEILIPTDGSKVYRSTGTNIGDWIELNNEKAEAIKASRTLSSNESLSLLDKGKILKLAGFDLVADNAVLTSEGVEDGFNFVVEGVGKIVTESGEIEIAAGEKAVFSVVDGVVEDIARSKNNYFYLLGAGQSQMLNRDENIDATNYTYVATPNVQVYNNVSLNDWEVYDPDVVQFTNDVAGHTSPAFFGARQLAEMLGVTVRVFISAEGGQSIDKWTPNTATNWVAFLNDYAAAGSPHLSAVWWIQGESDTTTQTADYLVKLRALISEVRKLGDKGATTKFIASTLYEPGGSASHFGNSYQSKAVRQLNKDGDPYTACIDSSRLPQMGDNLHFHVDSQIKIGGMFARETLTNNQNQGCVLHLDARRGVTLDDDNHVTSWEDMDNGVISSSVTGTLLQTTANGHTWIEADNGYIDFPIEWNHPSTVIVVMHNVDNDRVIYDTTNRVALFFGNGSPTTLTVRNNSQSSVQNQVRDGRAGVFAVVYDRDNTILYDGRELISSKLKTGTQKTSGARLRLFAADTSTGTVAQDMRIAHLLIFNKKLETYEIDKLVKTYEFEVG